ncbi:TetR/AcrR family transcriptional regulator [Rhizobiales bacterium]|uniref:TetR/AcrR family transcriptional regulator n=1 Tax=Hongsoonwoonella zoysiae TaxID=2821844 RepID=UPI0015614021|nr:TetR/AcrR family transcriptional regulator [Hongsoonwoonella zoysiae]NRG17940.1 TetR/AcrR family transcriptional regulator [Hongsoonwoonella zoysiae]
MGRPAKFDREEAIEIAMNEIWRNGFEACSAKALSERLGITRSSFYNAFENREALFREVLARYFAQSPDNALTEAEKGVVVKKLITEVFRQACSARAGDPQARGCLVINSVSELCGVHDELGGVIKSAVLGSLERFEELLRWGVEQGEFPASTDVHALALSLQNLLIGINAMSKVVRDEADLWLAANTTLKALEVFAE